MKINKWIIAGFLALLLGLSFIPIPISKTLVFIWRISIIFSFLVLYLKPVHLTSKFFYVLTALSLLSVISFFIPIYPYVEASLVAFSALVICDLLILFNKNIKPKTERILPKIFSLGDYNQVKIVLKNNSVVFILIY